jgi:short-subunit dehydrogenase
VHSLFYDIRLIKGSVSLSFTEVVGNAIFAHSQIQPIIYMDQKKLVLLLGANSDVAKEAIKLYAQKGYSIVAASRNTNELQKFVSEQNIADQVTVQYFDAVAFDTHKSFYSNLPQKPHIVIYAAGFLKNNEEAMVDFAGSLQMMNVHYCGAVSILNIIATDKENANLERIVGLSSLSGVRGRKSNFIYGSTKSGFTQYLAGLRQYLFTRNIKVNVIVGGYIRSKMTAGLNLSESLMLEPVFIAKAVVNAGNRFTIVPGYKWKLIYQVLRMMPEKLVAKLP